MMKISISPMLVAVSPLVGYAPGLYGAVFLAAPSCGFGFAELPVRYPDASATLGVVFVTSFVFWIGWIIAFRRVPGWSEATHTDSMSSRLTLVGSTLGGIFLGIILSLVAYAVVAGVEEMCERVPLPIWLLVSLVTIPLAFVGYLITEVVVDFRRREKLT